MISRTSTAAQSSALRAGSAGAKKATRTVGFADTSTFQPAAAQPAPTTAKQLADARAWMDDPNNFYNETDLGDGKTMKTLIPCSQDIKDWANQQFADIAKQNLPPDQAKQKISDVETDAQIKARGDEMEFQFMLSQTSSRVEALKKKEFQSG